MLTPPRLPIRIAAFRLSPSVKEVSILRDVHIQTINNNNNTIKRDKRGDGARRGHVPVTYQRAGGRARDLLWLHSYHTTDTFTTEI